MHRQRHPAQYPPYDDDFVAMDSDTRSDDSMYVDLDANTPTHPQHILCICPDTLDEMQFIVTKARTNRMDILSEYQQLAADTYVNGRRLPDAVTQQFHSINLSLVPDF